MFLHLI